MKLILEKRRQIETSSYVIALINICLFGNMIGIHGMAYLFIAVEVYALFMTISVGSLSEVVRRVIKNRNSKGQYRSAQFFRVRTMLIHGVIGLVTSFLFLVLSGWISRDLIRVHYSISIMVVLSVHMILRTFNVMLIGFLRGDGNDVPTSLTNFLRQILVFVLGLIFVNSLKTYGIKVSDLLENSAYTAMYGAVGVAIALTLAELVILIYLIICYRKYRKEHAVLENEGLKQTETWSETFIVLTSARVMPMLTQLFIQLPVWIGMYYYRSSVKELAIFTNTYGFYAGKYMLLSFALSILVLSYMFSVNTKTIACLRKDEVKNARMYYLSGLHGIVVHSLFFTFFIALMAEQVAHTISKQVTGQFVSMLRQGSVIILLIVLGGAFTHFMFLAGKFFHVFYVMVVTNIIYFLTFMFCINILKTGVMTLVYAGIVSGVIYCIVLGFLALCVIRTGIDVIHMFLIPIVASCLMGIICLLMGKVMTPYLGNLTIVIITFLIGSVIFWIFLLFMHCFKEHELKYVSGGKMMCFLAKKFKIY